MSITKSIVSSASSGITRALAGAGTTPLPSFVPTDVASLYLWLDASDRGVTTNQWDDKSGSARHYTSASAGEFPTFAGGAASFDASADHLDGPSMAALTEGEIFCRFRVGSVGTANGIWHMGDHSAGEWMPFSSGTMYSGWGSSARVMSNVAPGVDLTAYTTLNIYSAANDWECLLNGVSKFSTATNTAAFPSNPRLRQTGDGTIIGAMDIKAVCVFSAKLSADDRASMLTYMNAL